MKKFGLILALSSFVVIGLGGCGQPPSKPQVSSSSAQAGVDADGDGIIDGTTTPVPGGGADGVAAGFPMAVSLASFKANIYEPVLEPFCASCHEKTFVDQDINVAHKYFLERSKFEAFAGLEQSLPVLKMKQAHNCWDAQVKTCVDMMSDKMNLWLKDLEANGYKPTPVKYPNSSTEVMLTSATPTAMVIPTEYAAGGIVGAVLAAPFTMATDDVDGAIKAYASAPVATARANNVNVAQSITFTMDAKVAGTYFVWARVKTPAATSNEFFIQANAAASVAFIPDVTGADTWKWQQVFIVANNANTLNPYTFNVAAPGAQTMRVQFREGGAKINQLVITTKADFNGDQFTKTFFDVTVPIVVPGVEGAKIVATVWEQTAEEGKRSVGVKELKMISPVPLKIKTIYPLINGLFHENQGTYTIVDTVAGGPDPLKAVISTGGSTATTWIADLKVDKLSFAFEVIEIAK